MCIRDRSFSTQNVRVGVFIVDFLHQEAAREKPKKSSLGGGEVRKSTIDRFASLTIFNY